MCVYVWHWIIHFYGWGHPWCQDKGKRARLNLRPVIFLGDTMDYTLGLNLCFDRKKIIRIWLQIMTLILSMPVTENSSL